MRHPDLPCRVLDPKVELRHLRLEGGRVVASRSFRRKWFLLSVKNMAVIPLSDLLEDPEYADSEMPLDLAGFVMNDLNDVCVHTNRRSRA
jgi:hypothetical protein